MIVTLIIWFFFQQLSSCSEPKLTRIFLGYPLAYYMTAQGSLLAFVLLIFWFANKQEKIDDECGFGKGGC